MLRKLNHTFSLLTVLALFNLAANASMGQGLESLQRAGPSSATVTVAASGEAVRFSAPGNITHIRLEVFSSAGVRVFDSGNRDGNVFDWRWQDEKASAFGADNYLCVVTVQSLSGKTSRKLADVSFANKQATLKPIELTQLNPAQLQALGSLETDTPLTIIDGDQSFAATVIAHDGNDGQITRTRGAFTFRFGDFFSGNDQEQMRLTEEGNLGIGTVKPKARLDVAGLIRAREGFQFSDGSTLNVNDKGVLTRTNADGTAPAAVSSTQNRIAKFTDNAGTVGDSVAIDTGTGLQLTAPPSPAVDTNLLYLNSTNGTAGVLAGSTPSYGAANGPFFAMRGNTYTTLANQRGLFTIAAGNVSNPVGDDGSVKFNTGDDLLRMVIRPSGYVGINTLVPSERLHVTGNGLFTGNLTVNGTLNATLPATNVTGVLAIDNGGTGSATQNFVDLSKNQIIHGRKTFFDPIFGDGSFLTNLSGSNVNGTVANAVNASTAGNVTGVVQIANGGTGSATKDFVDLSTDQFSIEGYKAFTGAVSVTSGTGGPTGTTLTVTGTQPPTSSGDGANAPDVLRVVGAKGGNTSNQSARALAGAGGNVLIQGGDGGDSSVPLTGVGGSITLQPGTGGFAGNVLLAPANGLVGIGTTSPQSTLHVFKSAEAPDTVGGNLIVNRFFSNAGGPGGGWRGASLFSYFPSAHNHDVLAFGVSEDTTAPNSIGAVKMVVSANGNVGIGVTNPDYLLDVGQRMRLRSGGNNLTSAGIHFNNNANSVAAFFGMEDDTHIGFFGNGGAGWKFGMNTATGALKVNGTEGQPGQVITSNGAGAAQWKSLTNSLYQQTNMNLESGSITPGSTPTTIPGLSQTVNVSGNAKLLVQFGVFAFRNFCSGCGASDAEIEVTLNGARANLIRQTVVPVSDVYFSGSWVLQVGAGSHTVEIKASSVGDPVGFCDGPASAVHCDLIVQVIPQ